MSIVSRFHALRPSLTTVGWLLLFCLVLAACQPAGQPAAQPTSPDGGGSSGTSSGQDQVAQGQAVYSQSCARCHGASGEGTTAPALIGSGASFAPYGKNAQELFNYISRYMPANAPSSLDEQSYWAVLAFILKQNSLYDGAKPLGPDNAAQVSVPR